MKLTSKILAVLLVAFTGGLFAANLSIKKIYENGEKDDLYLTYGSILQQPFNHLHITGGNVTNIVFEPRPTSSVRVYKEWYGYAEAKVKAMVRNDTLYLEFLNNYRDYYEKYYLMHNVLVRVFAPELKSITGINTNLTLTKFSQPDLKINLSGRSNFEAQSMLSSFQHITFTGSDSSQARIQMSPETKNKSNHSGKTPIGVFNEEKYGWALFSVGKLTATLTGSSVLDIGHAQIDSLNLSVADTASILLSGGAMRKVAAAEKNQ